MEFKADGIPLGTYRPLEDTHYVIEETAIYYLDDDTGDLVSYDLATGRQRLSISFDSFGGKLLSLPVVADGRVFVAYVVKVAGTGTKADQYLMRAQALDAETGKTLWETDLEEAYADDTEASFEDATPFVFAADAKHVIVAMSHGFGSNTAVLTAKDGEVLWKDPSFVPYGFDGQVVAGKQVTGEFDNREPPEGRAVADGTRRWKLPDQPPNKEPGDGWGGAAPVQGTETTDKSFFIIDAGERLDDPPYVLVIRVRDGKEIIGIDHGDTHAAPDTCRHDGQRTFVCEHWNEVVVAYDDQSGKELWRLPDEGADRVAPDVTAVRHGAVYGSTDNGALILDARTGKDKATDLAIAPEYVGPGFGIAPKGETGEDSTKPYLHPAVG